MTALGATAYAPVEGEPPGRWIGIGLFWPMLGVGAARVRGWRAGMQTASGGRKRFPVLRLALQAISALVILYAGVWMVAGLAELLELRWPEIPLRAGNDGYSPIPWTMAALTLSVASFCFFLWELLWERGRPGRTTPPALYLGIMAILLLQLGLLFSAESVYDYLWRTFK